VSSDRGDIAPNKAGGERIETKLNNCTPHEITLLDDEGNTILTLDKCDTPVRVSSSFTEVGTVTLMDDNNHRRTFPVSVASYGATEGMPEPEDGTLHVVARIVAEANLNRLDLLIVNDTVRDDTGRIIGCKGFARLRLTDLY
jgi:hypothetical protein